MIDFIIRTKNLNGRETQISHEKMTVLLQHAAFCDARGAWALGWQRGCQGEGVGGCGPAPPPPQTVLHAGLQSGLDLEIGLCLLHGVFAQGSLSGEAYQLTLVNSYQLTKHVYTFSFIQKRS